MKRHAETFYLPDIHRNYGANCHNGCSQKRHQTVGLFCDTLWGVFDTLIILVVTHLLKIGGYINFGPFGILGIPFFPPIAWTIYFVLYFYTIPQTKPWVYIFPVISAMYSVLFSNVLANLGIFKWNYGQVIVPFLIYLTWNFLNTFAYIRLFEPDNELANSSTHGRMAFKPALLKKIHYKRK